MAFYFLFTHTFYYGFWIEFSFASYIVATVCIIPFLASDDTCKWWSDMKLSVAVSMSSPLRIMNDMVMPWASLILKWISGCSVGKMDDVIGVNVAVVDVVEECVAEGVCCSSNNGDEDEDDDCSQNGTDKSFPDPHPPAAWRFANSSGRSAVGIFFGFGCVVAFSLPDNCPCCCCCCCLSRCCRIASSVIGL